MHCRLLRAGAAQRVITPPPGVRMAGWGNERAAGDNIARYVHDELRVKALALQQGSGAWILLAADLVRMNAMATERIRQGITAQTSVPPEAILVCATHCHSGPVVCPAASAYTPEEWDRPQTAGQETDRELCDGTAPPIYAQTAGQETGRELFDGLSRERDGPGLEGGVLLREARASG